MAEVASAYVSLLPSAKGFGRQIDSEIGGDLDSSGKSGGKRFGAGFAGSLKRVMGPAIALIGAAAVGSLLRDSIGEAREAQKVGALTEQIIKSTGGAAKVTAKDVGDLASAISAKAGIDDEAIQSGANLLLTFKNVRNEAGNGAKIFDRATQAAVDLSAAGFGSVESTSKQLGKALNDPIKGMSMLGRAGVTFTAGQEKLIKGMAASGDLLGAQKVMLKEVESQVGGAAAASATSGEKLSVAWGNLSEQIGTALLPVIDKLATFLTAKVVPALSTAISYLQANPGVVYGFAAAVGVLGVAFIAATAPISLTALAIAALVGGLVYAYNKFPAFRAAVNSTFQAIKTAVMTVLPFVKSYIQSAFTVIGGLFKVFSSLIKGDWTGVWSGLKQVVRGAWGVIKTIVSAGWAVVKAVFRVAGSAIVSLARSAFSRLRGAAIDGVSKLISYVKGIPGRLTGAFSALPSLMWSIGKRAIQGLINGIKAMAGQAVDAARGVAKNAIDGAKNLLKINSPSRVFHEIGLNTGAGLITGLNASQSAVADASSNLARSVAVPATSRFDGAAVSGGRSEGVSMDDLFMLADMLREATDATANAVVDSQLTYSGQLGRHDR